MRYIDKEIDKKTMAWLVTECYEKNGHERTVKLLMTSRTSASGTRHSPGMTISMTDMDIPSKRDEIVEATQASVARKNREYTQRSDHCRPNESSRCWSCGPGPRRKSRMRF